MINVGECIRTDKGKLGKVIRIWESEYKHDRTRYLVDWGNGRATYISQIKNVKHSKNIIVLVEVGDYINGERVTYKGKTKTGRTQIITEDSTDFFLKYEYIETILTHEMYEQNCYKVGED